MDTKTLNLLIESYNDSIMKRDEHLYPILENDVTNASILGIADDVKTILESYYNGSVNLTDPYITMENNRLISLTTNGVLERISSYMKLLNEMNETLTVEPKKDLCDIWDVSNVPSAVCTDGSDKEENLEPSTPKTPQSTNHRHHRHHHHRHHCHHCPRQNDTEKKYEAPRCDIAEPNTVDKSVYYAYDTDTDTLKEISAEEFNKRKETVEKMMDDFHKEFNKKFNLPFFFPFL